MSDYKPKILPAPAKLLDGAEMKVQEAIHGHRILNEQEPYMIVLETLAVCASTPLGEVHCTEESHESFSYNLPHRQKMRFLLFQDWHLEAVAADNMIPDIEKWDKWKERVNFLFDQGNGVQDNFAYLDDKFGRNFDELLHSVRLVKSLELDVMNNRRWTSRFITVTGEDMICTDMKESSNRKWTADRRFFGRCGELVYLMLNRYSGAEELSKLIQSKFLNFENHLNLITKKLNDQNDKSCSQTSIGYLPFHKHNAYERMGEDWHSVLSLPELPDGHHFEPIFRITGLNLLVYLAERAQEETDSEKSEPIIADFMDGADKQLRESSKEHLIRHRQASLKAVNSYIENQVKNDPDWKIVISSKDPITARSVIKKLFKYEDKENTAQAPSKQLQDLIEKAKKRSKNNAHKFLLPLIKESGIGGARAGIGTWFNVDDSMILALVLANVSQTMELKDLVKKLYERYRIVIGPDEARKEFRKPPVGIQVFEANLEAFESRMTRLALTNRLSDDCAFVTNPYWREND